MDDDFPPSAGPLDDDASSSSDRSADRSDALSLPPAAEVVVNKPDERRATPTTPATDEPTHEHEHEQEDEHNHAAAGAGGLEDWPDHRWLTIGRRLGASPMQLRIMRLMLVEELSNESIAHRLGHSRMSVDTQISRLYKKIGVKSRMGLVKRVYSSWALAISKYEETRD